MRRRLRAAALLMVAGAAALALGGCQVSTRVAVDETSAGQGTIVVAVTFDRAAVATLGGFPAMARNVDLKGLMPAGWQVSGPSPAPDSGAVIIASHAFESDAQASQLIASLAGSGPASSRPFRLTLTNRKTFWHVYSSLSGAVDLTCELACFGDTGLKAATGQVTGVDPAALLGKQDPAQVFSFELQAHLPGGLSQTNATNRSSVGGSQVLGWTPQLGRIVLLSVETESWNRGSVILVGSITAGVLLVILIVVGRWMWRRHFRRGVGAHSKGRKGGKRAEPASSLAGPAPVVEPAPVVGPAPVVEAESPAEVVPAPAAVVPAPAAAEPEPAGAEPEPVASPPPSGGDPEPAPGPEAAARDAGSADSSSTETAGPNVPADEAPAAALESGATDQSAGGSEEETVTPPP